MYVSNVRNGILIADQLFLFLIIISIENGNIAKTPNLEDQNMKRILLFFSIFALLTACLANPPPVIIEQNVTLEFVADDLSVNLDGVNQEKMNFEYQDYLQIALPLAFDMPGSLITAPVVEISASDANYSWYTSQATTNNQDAAMWNLILVDDKCQLYRSYENRLHLATKENEFIVMGLARLDIGENVSFS